MNEQTVVLGLMTTVEKNVQIIKIQNKSDLEKCFPMMRELRPHLSLMDYMMLYEKAHTHDGYEIVGLLDSENIVAIMGFRILYDFVHGKHLYIDDLVTTEQYRSKGFGQKLLQYAEQVATDKNCQKLRLSTGVENERGKSFYEKHGWKLRAVVYKK